MVIFAELQLGIGSDDGIARDRLVKCGYSLADPIIIVFIKKVNNGILRML